jgi:8-oxo-dGTP pyrophosphatase MutT (NUDIX family)
MLTFPAIGIWRPGEITTSWRESSRRIIPDVEQIIEETWAAAMSRPGIHLFDGPMCRLESLERRGDHLHLTLSPTSYKIFVGTNLTQSELADAHGHQILANPIGLSTALISSDGFLMLGRRNGRVAYYPNRVHPFAGCLEPSENLDVFDDALRELKEELSLQRQDNAEIVCTGIAEDLTLRQPEICFAATSTKSARQIESQLDAEEHAGIWKTPIGREAIESALQSDEVFTPMAVAAMLLWGRIQFGDNWFETWREN